MSRFPSIKFTLFLTLPLMIFMTSCNKFKTAFKEEMARGKSEKVRVSTCCWCVDANTNANVVSNYISPKYCEEAVNDPSKPLTDCKKVKVDSERCSFQKISDRRPDRPGRKVDQYDRLKEARLTTDLKIHGKDEFITAVSPQPTHCNRDITSAGEALSNDPRCQPEACKCFADENLPWNCELMIIRKDGKKESLGQRPKLDRENTCDAATCKELFAREVHAFCPSFQ